MASKKQGSILARRCAKIFGMLGMLYLTPFFLVFMDEVIFKTYWFAKHFPLWTQMIFWRLYPFYEFAFQMMDPRT